MLLMSSTKLTFKKNSSGPLSERQTVWIQMQRLSQALKVLELRGFSLKVLENLISLERVLENHSKALNLPSTGGFNTVF